MHGAASGCQESKFSGTTASLTEISSFRHCYAVIQVEAKVTIHTLTRKINIKSYRFWATVTSNGSPYATGPLFYLSCLCVKLVYCGQTVGWIKVPLGMEVGLDPGYTMLDGAPAPPTERGTGAPTFRPMSSVAKWSPISATAELLL